MSDYKKLAQGGIELLGTSDNIHKENTITFSNKVIVINNFLAEIASGTLEVKPKEPKGKTDKK